MKSHNKSFEPRKEELQQHLNISLWDQHLVTLIWKNRVFGVFGGGGVPPASSPANVGQTGFVEVVSNDLLT